MDDMEVDSFENNVTESNFVLDTPDRLAGMHQKSRVNRDNDPSFWLGSPGRNRQRWRGNNRFSNERDPLNKENNDCIVRRVRLSNPVPDSVDTLSSCPHVTRRKSQSCDASGHASTSGQIIASTSSRNEDVNTSGPSISSGISCPKIHPSDKRKLDKDSHGKNHNDSVEVIEVLDSPEPQPIRKSVKDAIRKLPENKSVVEGTDAAIRHPSLGPDLKNQRQQPHFRPLKLENRVNTTTQRMLAQNELSSPSKSVKCGAAKNGEISPAGGSNHKNLGEITDLCSNSVTKNELLNHDATTRKTGRRKLVRNGCIAPSNIAKVKNVLDIRGDGKSKIVDNSSAETIPETSPNSERYLTDKMKGKEICYGNDHVIGRNLKPESSSRRQLAEDASSDDQEDISWIVEESSWRTTGNRKGAVGNSRKKSSFPELPIQIHEISIGDREHANKINDNPETDSSGMMPSFPLEPATSSAVRMCTNKAARGLDKSPTILKGKRKSRSARNHLGDSSNILESDFFSSFGQSSTPLPARSCNSHKYGTSNVSVIDVDGLCSPGRCTSPQRIASTADDSRARALQLEADEQLARQLQEQLFNEDPVFGGNEIDESIAWTLQQEEDSQNTHMIQSRHPQTRGTSAAHLSRPYSRNSVINPSGRIQSHARASARISNFRRSLNRRNMDLDSRIDFLEALEAAFDASIEERVPHRTNSLLHIQRDFNEDDYEMLLSLDNDNDRHCGASLHQINSLPLSKVQSENGEACAVCLETPTLGETIRHLPCLHKFHKDCIDTWLRRKTSCPVCKCGIT